MCKRGSNLFGKLPARPSAWKVQTIYNCFVYVSDISNGLKSIDFHRVYAKQLFSFLQPMAWKNNQRIVRQVSCIWIFAFTSGGV